MESIALEYSKMGRRFSLGSLQSNSIVDNSKPAGPSHNPSRQSLACEQSTLPAFSATQRETSCHKISTDRQSNPMRTSSTHGGMSPGSRLFQPIGAGRRTQNLSATSRLTLRVFFPRRPRRHNRPSDVPDDFIPSAHPDDYYSQYAVHQEPQIRLKSRQRSFSRMNSRNRAEVLIDEVTSVIGDLQRSDPSQVTGLPVPSHVRSNSSPTNGELTSCKDRLHRSGNANNLDKTCSKLGNTLNQAAGLSNHNREPVDLELAIRPDVQRAVDVTLEARVRRLEEENSFLRSRVSHLLKIISGNGHRPPSPPPGFESRKDTQDGFLQGDQFDRDDELHRLRRETRQLKASLVEVGRENERLCSTMADLRIKGVEQMRSLQDEQEELGERLSSSRETCQRLEDALYHVRDCILSNVDKSDPKKLAEFHDLMRLRVQNVVSKLDLSLDKL